MLDLLFSTLENPKLFMPCIEKRKAWIDSFLWHHYDNLSKQKFILLLLFGSPLKFSEYLSSVTLVILNDLQQFSEEILCCLF